MNKIRSMLNRVLGIPPKPVLHERGMEFCGIKINVNSFRLKDLYDVVKNAKDGSIVVLDSDTFLIVRQGDFNENGITGDLV